MTTPYKKDNLPSHYLQLFQSIVKQYENKNFKKALRTADEILAKFPNHADTLAMKGLIYKAQDRVEEGYNLVKEGLKHSSFSSSICWHVMGLMYREDKNHEQAVKAYINALRFDPQNLKIMNDLASMQMHLRDYQGLLATRQKLLQQKPTINVHWIGFAVAQHMAGRRDNALSTIDTFLQLAELTSKYEISEVHLYKNSIIAEFGNPERTLKHLQEIESLARDPIYILETKGKCLLQIGKNLAEARHVYHQLLKLNSENYEYHGAYQQAHGFSADTTTCSNDQIEPLLKHYDRLRSEFPKSAVIKRIALNFAKGEEFRKRVEEFIRKYLARTIPSLFSALKSLYTNSEKVQIIEDIFLSYEKSLEETGKLPGNDNVEAPSTILWTLSYLAYHYDRIGQTEKGLTYIEKAIHHTPTLLELYQVKARLLKHLGDYNQAAEVMDLARRMDLADRYLNTKGTKYLLRADRTKDAMETINLFARDPEGNLNIHDMQCMWFENETGESFLRQGKIGQALRQFDYVRSHIEEMIEDQYDFHQYSLRKLVLRSYIEMLRFVDRIRSIHFYERAAKGLVRCYMILHENPSVKEHNKTQQEVDEYEQKKKNAKPKKKDDEEGAKNKDEDYFGEKLMSVENPLLEATKYIKHLLEFSGEKLDVHLLAIDLYLHRKKYLLALKSIKAARKANETDPQLHFAIVKFYHQYQQDKNTLDGTVTSIIDKEIEFVGDINTFNDEYLKLNEKSYAARVAVSKSLKILNKDEKRAQDLILNVENATLQASLDAYDYVKGNDQVKNQLRERLLAVHKYANKFNA
jgi:tetratricopeptide (TPR) repeat protein